MSLSAFGNTNLISETVSQSIGEMERDQLGEVERDENKNNKCFVVILLYTVHVFKCFW